MSKKETSSLFLRTLQKSASQIHQQADELNRAKIEGQAKAAIKEQHPSPSSIDPATIQDLHQQCQQRIKQFEQLYNDAKKQLLDSNKQTQKMKDELVFLETKAKEKALELARVNGIYYSQVDKTLKAREQADKLTANLRATSSQLKNALTAYHTMQRVQQSADTHQREAMSKLIRHYERELYPNETLPGDELDVKKLVKLTQEQQADIDGLLSKLLQREEQVNNAKVINQEILRQLREDTVFQQDLCTKIEESLTASVNIDRELQKRCQQLANQNQKLRLRNQQLEKGRAREQVFESSIRSYEQQLKRLLEALRKKTLEEVEHLELMQEREILMQQRPQWYQDQLQKFKINEAEQKKQVDNLLQEKEEGKKVRKRLEQQLEISERKESILKRKLEQLKRQKWYSEIHSQTILAPSLNQTVPSQVSAKESFFEPLLVTSEILQRKMSLRVQLAEQVRNTYGWGKLLTKLLFRYDKYNWNFANYLEVKSRILLLMTIGQRIIAAYAYYDYLPTQEDPDQSSNDFKAFLGFCDGKEWKWRLKRKQEFKKLRSVRFLEGNLIFGNNQLIIRGNSSQREAIFNNKVFGATFFEQINMNVLPNGHGPTFQYDQLEIHKIQP